MDQETYDRLLRERGDASNSWESQVSEFTIRDIIDYLNAVGEAKTVDIAKKIGLSPVRTRVILANMPELEALGGNRNRTYRQKDNRK